MDRRDRNSAFSLLVSCFDVIITYFMLLHCRLNYYAVSFSFWLLQVVLCVKNLKGVGYA
jgi:hypothetical protein